jgi:hypothetical protein
MLGLLMATALLCVLTYYDTSVADTDVWWHMAYGRQVLEDRSLRVDHGIFANSELTAPWRYVSWLGDVVLYTSHEIAGSRGLEWLRTLLYLLVAILAWRSIPDRARTGLPIFLLAVVATFLAAKSTAVLPKNSMFSAALLASVMAVHTTGRRVNHRRFWLLPVIFLAWVNTHGEVIIGILALLVLVAAEIAVTRLRRRGAMGHPELRTFVAATAASCAVIIINPEGPALPLYWVQAAIGDHDRVMTGFLHDTIPTVTHLLPESPQEWPRTVVTWIWLAMSAGLAVSTLRAIRGHDGSRLPAMTAALVLVIGSWLMGRLILLAAVSWLFAMMPVLARLSWVHSATGLRTAAASLGILLVAAVGCKTLVYYEANWWGPRVGSTRPVAAARFLYEHQLPGPIFNDYLSGGALIWDLGPKTPVFIDPRITPYDHDLAADYLEFHLEGSVDRLERLRQRYGFRTAILGYVGTDEMVAAFQAAPRWVLVYLGPRATIFVDAMAVPTIANLHESDPFCESLYDETTDLRQFNRLLTVASRVAPEKTVPVYRALQDQVPRTKLLKARALARMERYFGRCAFISGDGSSDRLTPAQVKQRFAMYFLAGSFELARLVAMGYLQERPHDAAMRYNLACVDSRIGDLDHAARSLERAIADGYADRERLASDPDLEPLRSDPRLATIFGAHRTGRPLTDAAPHAQAGQ